MFLRKKSYLEIDSVYEIKDDSIVSYKEIPENVTRLNLLVDLKNSVAIGVFNHKVDVDDSILTKYYPSDKYLVIGIVYM
ncbi:MAG: hypothetical protein LBB76_12910 [Azoarcus sp.]|jgi:hypothetical protein|nr:hypothetical protein [Azoarcus sp.]